MKILITEPKNFSHQALKNLKELGTIIFGPFTREELIDEIADVSILVLRLGHVIDNQVIEKAKNLKYILTPTTGLNHIDTSICKQKNVTVLSLFEETEFLSTIPSTSEHSWALLLSLIRQIPAAFDSVKKGDWERDSFKSSNLNALTIGILGLGRVGKQIAHIANAFNMKVYGYDSKNMNSIANVTLVDNISELMKVSDVLSIHVNLTEENKYLINKENLQYAKEGMYIINTSRGELINENDLVSYLASGKLKGVAVDVLDNELNAYKRNSSTLLAYAKGNDNVIITPHIAGVTKESMHMTEDFIVDKLLEVLKA